MDPDIGTGATLTFSGFTANITAISHGDISRESIDTSHLGTTPARTFLEGDLHDPGTIEVEFQFDTREPLSNKLPIEGVQSALVLTFPLVVGDTSAATMTCDAFMTAANYSLPLEDLVTGTATFKLSDEIAWVDYT